MQLPFTAAQFIQVFARYNAVVWPMAILAYLAGATAVYFALRPSRRRDIAVGAALAGMWAFTGIGYHILSFAPINPIAKVFGAAFVVQAVIFVVAGVRGCLHFTPRNGARTKTGLALVAFSMLVYPALGFVFGHGFPNGPVFGLAPCPLTIFTFGLLLMADAPRLRLAVIPALWALIGSTAAMKLGIREDLGLLVSVVTYAGFAVAQARVGMAARKSAATGYAATAR